MERSAAVVARLLLAGAIRRVAPGDGQLFADCDLASNVLSRFQVDLDPRTLDDAVRAEWTRRAVYGGKPVPLPSERDYRACFWVMDGERRTGTVALATHTSGSAYLEVFSLYVFSELRRTGVASRLLDQVVRAATDASFMGIKLASEWISTPAVTFYLHGVGMWVRNLKRSVDFVWDPQMPRHRIHVGAEEASFAIDTPEGPLVLLTAQRRGDVLVERELPALGALSDRDEARYLASPTFAVALALAGWPLLAAGVDLSTGWRGDLGGPDVLAEKIAGFEWWARKQGYQVRTPRIPGLPYEALAALYDAE